MYVYIQKCIFWHIWCIGRRINRINISGQLMFSCYEKRFRRPKILTHQLLDSIGIWNLLFLFVIWWWRKSNCIAYHLLAFVIWFTFTFFIIPWCFLRVFCIPEVLKSLNESKQWLLASSRPTKPKLILFVLSISNFKLHTYIIHIYLNYITSKANVDTCSCTFRFLCITNHHKYFNYTN